MTRTPDGYRMLDVTEARREDVLDLDRLSFAFGTDPEVDAAVPVTLDWTRTVVLERPEGQIAALHSSYPFTLPVPGGEVPCAGLTWVGVRPDHRRRGLLTAMIDAHFERSLARGEPVSALFAAEPAIYGRFGYGLAADDLRLSLGRGAALRDVAGSAELELRLDSVSAEHLDLIHAVHAAAGTGRPGWIQRTTPSLRARHIADPRSWREGAENLRIVTVGDGDEPRGYALFRRKANWSSGGPKGVVAVLDLAAVDGAAAHRLWAFLLDLDLMATVESAMLAVDDPLLQLLVDPRSAVPRVADNIWVRLLDVPVALAARRYAAPVDVVLEVTDSLLPANAGRWRVRTGAAPSTPGQLGLPAEITATAEPADLALDVRELGAAYLGGRSLAAFSGAGLVAARTGTGTLLAASTAFGWPVAPLCSWVF